MLNRKLLEPGWAGDLNSEELAFIKDKLKRDRRLRAKWGMGRGKGRLSEEKIKIVALYGVEGLEETHSQDLSPPFQLGFVGETVTV